MCEDVVEQLKRCYQDEDFQWIMDSTYSEQACEVSISDYSKGYRKEYIIDRTFVDSQGTRWIIDYKSSANPDSMTREEFILNQEATYSDQLKRYADLFRQMESRPIKTALYFTASPYLHVF